MEFVNRMSGGFARNPASLGVTLLSGIERIGNLVLGRNRFKISVQLAELAVGKCVHRIDDDGAGALCSANQVAAAMEI